MTTTHAEAVYDLPEAAAIKRVSVDTLRKAIHATEGPVLKAKKNGRKYLISASALDDWFNSLPDA